MSLPSCYAPCALPYAAGTPLHSPACCRRSAQQMRVQQPRMSAWHSRSSAPAGLAAPVRQPLRRQRSRRGQQAARQTLHSGATQRSGRTAVMAAAPPCRGVGCCSRARRPPLQPCWRASSGHRRCRASRRVGFQARHLPSTGHRPLAAVQADSRASAMGHSSGEPRCGGTTNEQGCRGLSDQSSHNAFQSSGATSEESPMCRLIPPQA